jgi:hypothetical protein
MKTRTVPASHTRSGSAVLVLIVLLAIIMGYIAANLRSLHYLSRELKLVERQQLQRLPPAAQNSAPAPKP